MRNASAKVAITPRNNAFNNRSDLIFIPFVGGQAGSIGVSLLTIGYPTNIVLSSSHTGIIGQYVYISGLNGPTGLNGNFYKVIDKGASSISLDVDSGAMATWTSGGSVNFDVLHDRCGNLSPQLILGTTTNIWGNPLDGLTSHSSGNNTAHIPTVPEMLNFTDANYVVMGATVTIGATPSAYEQILAIGQRVNSAGTNGHLGLAISTSGTNVEMTTRMASQGNGGNTFSYSTNIGTSTSAMVAGFVNFKDAIQYMYLNGVMRDADAVSQTNAIARPNGLSGMCIGADYNAALSLSNKFGSAGTPSQSRVRDLFIWRPSNNMTPAEIHSVISEYHRQGEWPILD